MTATGTELPSEVRVIERLSNLLQTGGSLSTTILLPQTDVAVAAVLEHLPYRKDDGTLWRDQAQLGYLDGARDPEGVIEGGRTIVRSGRAQVCAEATMRGDKPPGTSSVDSRLGAEMTSYSKSSGAA